MELYQDLIQRPEQRKFQFGLGMLFIIIVAALILIKLLLQESFAGNDWMFSIAMTGNGIFHIVEGRGKSFSSLFDKAYVTINEEYIKIKPSIIKKEQRFFWNDIKEMKIRLYEVEIMDKNETFHPLKYGDVDYSVLKEVKETLRKIGTIKNIEIK